MNQSIYLTLILGMSIFNLFGQCRQKTTEKHFKFRDPETKAVFSCDHVLNGKRPILFVSHDLEGDWQFLCGQEEHTEKNAKVISLKEATELDQTINDLYEMPKGVGADRKSIQDNWTPFQLPTN